MAWYEKATDDFNRTSTNPLDGNWETISGASPWRGYLDIRATPSAATTSYALYNGVTLGDNQYCRVGYNSHGSYWGLICRWVGSETAGSGYRWYATGTVLDVYKNVAGTWTKLGASITCVNSINSNRFNTDGTTLGIIEGDVSLATRTDSAVTTGRTGMWGTSYVNAQMDDFSCGDDVGTAGGVPIFIKQYRHRWGA